MLSSFVLMGTESVSSMSVVAKPTCGDTGPSTPVALILLMPANEASKDAAFRRFAEDLGSAWRVRLQSGDGTDASGNNAIALKYCWYPGT
jgi:hypothetical protein